MILVSDAGPGIAPKAIPRLFDRFHRGAAAQTVEAAGFGLGLAISRAAVEPHGGRIAAEPRPGGGATFSIRLPLAGCVDPSGLLKALPGMLSPISVPEPKREVRWQLE